MFNCPICGRPLKFEMSYIGGRGYVQTWDCDHCQKWWERDYLERMKTA